jgi:hypothetical protein
VNATPANWSILAINQAANISTYILWYPNNPGGLTGFTLNCTATTGGISESFFEYTGLPILPTNTYQFKSSGTGTAIPQLFTQQVNNSSELCLALVASNATATFSSSSTRTVEWAGNVNGIGSTGATTNTRNNTYWAVNTDSGTPLITGTLNTSVVWSVIGVRLATNDSGEVTNVIVGGSPGVLQTGQSGDNYGRSWRAWIT